MYQILCRASVVVHKLLCCEVQSPTGILAYWACEPRRHQGISSLRIFVQIRPLCVTISSRRANTCPTVSASSFAPGARRCGFQHHLNCVVWDSFFAPQCRWARRSRATPSLHFRLWLAFHCHEQRPPTEPQSSATYASTVGSAAEWPSGRSLGQYGMVPLSHCFDLHCIATEICRDRFA